jgi:hypothetical protein
VASSDLSPGARIAIGVVIALAGVAACVMGMATAWAQAPLSDDHWVGLPLGVALASFGALLAAPSERMRLRGILAALVVTGFALTFDWIAFGPGERHFTASAGNGAAGVHTTVGSRTGRIAFGVFAVLLDASAIFLWRAALRPGGIKISD